MKLLLILSSTFIITQAYPQQGGYNYPQPNYQQQTRVDSQGVTVTCEQREVSPGRFEFNCANANPGTVVEEKILWVPTSGSSQELLIRVPNYRLQEIIRAGLRAREQGQTNVRIHVARPEVQSVVEGEFRQQGAGAPNVQVSYDGIVPTREVHYGGSGVAYSALSKAIQEPGAGRFKKAVE